MKKQVLKSLIIQLSKENCLITQFTSFVAVEKRVSIVAYSCYSPYIYILTKLLSGSRSLTVPTPLACEGGRGEMGRLTGISVNGTQVLLFLTCTFKIYYHFVRFGHFSSLINPRPSKNRQGWASLTLCKALSPSSAEGLALPAPRHSLPEALAGGSLTPAHPKPNIHGLRVPGNHFIW